MYNTVGTNVGIYAGFMLLLGLHYVSSNKIGSDVMVLDKIIVVLLLDSFQEINLNSLTGILIRSCIRLVEFSNRKRGWKSNSVTCIFSNSVRNGNRVRHTQLVLERTSCACGAQLKQVICIIAFCMHFTACN